MSEPKFTPGAPCPVVWVPPEADWKAALKKAEEELTPHFRREWLEDFHATIDAEFNFDDPPAEPARCP